MKLLKACKLKRICKRICEKISWNALGDISKKFPELIKIELDSLKLESKEIRRVYKLASQLIV